MNESSRIHERLRTLLEPELPSTLWQRVESKSRQKIRRRRMGTMIATFAIVSAMVIPLLFPFIAVPESDHTAHLSAQPRVSSARDVHDELRALDHALQVAYDRGASDEEIAPMWVARKVLLANRRSAQAAAQNNRT